EHRVVTPLLAVHLAVAEGVAEGHQHLAIAGIAVIPGNSEVGSGDTEAFQGLIGAVRSGHPVDDRRRGTRDVRRWRGCRPRCRLRGLRLHRSHVRTQLTGVGWWRYARGGRIRPGRNDCHLILQRRGVSLSWFWDE